MYNRTVDSGPFGGSFINPCLRAGLLSTTSNRRPEVFFMPKGIYPHRTIPVQERFWNKVNKDGPTPDHRPELGPCWLWTGSKTRDGYGQISVDGETTCAHRISWILQNGEIPDGKSVLHECDNPTCVRHLFLGDQSDNMKDCARKGRCRTSKLTREAVISIRLSAYPNHKLAEIHGVSEGHIRKIKCWKEGSHGL